MVRIDADSFWFWALSHYRDTTLREALLVAQDQHGFIVLELMLAAWLAELSCVYTGAERTRALLRAKPWHESVLEPLRAQRRAWKATAEVSGEAMGHETLYSRLARLELAAERELADLLVSPLSDGLAPGQGIDCVANFAPLIAENPESAHDLQGLARRFDQLRASLP